MKREDKQNLVWVNKRCKNRKREKEIEREKKI